MIGVTKWPDLDLIPPLIIHGCLPTPPNSLEYFTASSIPSYAFGRIRRSQCGTSLSMDCIVAMICETLNAINLRANSHGNLGESECGTRSGISWIWIPEHATICKV